MRGASILKKSLFFALALITISTLAANPTVSSQEQKDALHCFYVRKYNAHTKHYYYVKRCRKTKTFDEKVSNFLQTLTPDQDSALQQRLEQEKKVQKSRYGISFFEPTYILPFYYTDRPYREVYQGHTPDNQKVMSEELKAQLSFKIPIWLNMFHSDYSLYVTYTQLSYWQLYANSQYFRETNYEPSLFVSDNFLPNWLASLGVVHQSNGRGIPLERSWNRLFLDVSFSGKQWLVSIKPWLLIFRSDSSDLHNPDIADFLGYERIVIAYKFYHQEISLMFRNTIESGFSRGAIEADYEFPIHGKLHGYVQFFSGYGQSLIEYNHYTNSAGVGIVLSNWI